jgi:uncharacterized protein YsxB (DUF464 family)
MLRGFDADGHAGTEGAGRNLACAAATTLLRTAGRLCEQRGFAAAGGAAEPGTMTLLLGEDAAEADAGWLKGLTDFLLRGLKDLAQEFPREILVRTETTEV